MVRSGRRASYWPLPISTRINILELYDVKVHHQVLGLLVVKRHARSSDFQMAPKTSKRGSGRGMARTPKGQKCGKRVKNADDAENAQTAQEKRANAAELSPVDPTDVICSSWTRSGEIKSTGLLLATFNKVHILTY